MEFTDKEYANAKKVIQSLKKHGVLKGDHCTESQYIALWNAALEIATGKPVDTEKED